MSDLQSLSKPPSTGPKRPFPSVTGGCFCNKTRYRLDRPPLFCNACHCSDCQKDTGSVYGCFVIIECTAISYGSIPPKITNTIYTHPIKKVRSVASCGICGTELWTVGDHSAYTAVIKVGTLDHPRLMEPDLHVFIENKIPWVILPEGAKTCEGQYDFRKAWPASSLARFDEEQRKAESAQAVGSGEAEGNAEEEDMIETPTAQSPDEEIEDDAEFEKRTMEAERALLERLEKLTLKLEGQEKEENVREA